MRYILDTSVLITSNKVTYPPDIFKKYWKVLTDLANQEKFESIDKVESEINKGNKKDYVRKWKDDLQNKNFFKSTKDDNCVKEYGNIINKVKHFPIKKYKPKAFYDFCSFDKADAFLIAYASLKKQTSPVTIVTDEIKSTKQTIIKIPDICDFFKIGVCNIIEMLRELKVII